MPKTLRLWAIPAGTREAKCKSCRASIYWIETGRGKPMPISTKVEGGAAPTATSGGQGVAHFADCPNAAAHRQARA